MTPGGPEGRAEHPPGAGPLSARTLSVRTPGAARPGRTLDGMTQPDRKAHTPAGSTPAAAPAGEVLISGLDTGPRVTERENLSPTDAQARFRPQDHPAQEPTDEDG